MHILFALLASLALLIPGTGMVAAGMLDGDGPSASWSDEGPDVDWSGRGDYDFDDQFDFDLEFDDDRGTFQFRDHDLAFGDGSGAQGNRQIPNAQGQDGTDAQQNQQNQDGTDAQQGQQNQQDPNAQNQAAPDQGTQDQNAQDQATQDQNTQDQADATTQRSRGIRPGKGQRTQDGTATQQDQSQGTNASVTI